VAVAVAVAGAAGEDKRAPRENQPIDITIDSFPFVLGGRVGNAMAMNGSIPGPVVRLKENTEAVIRVTNKLSETSSIHWHGLILPPNMDGVPGVSFAGIKPGETFVYRFPVRQSGTYWCHSHSGGQELLGVYAPLVIDPAEPEPFRYDRDYTVLLSDWSFEGPEEIIGNLKTQAGYYNYQKRTLGDFFDEVAADGFSAALQNRLEWGAMRMDPTDFADVTGSTYTYLLNGHATESNWTALFRPGERVRLRFIDGAAMTFFDVRIPGLRMTLVQADGQNVEPVEIEEFRIGPGETYDVIVEPSRDEAYTVFAESIDRSGFVSGTLAPREGMRAAVPPRRKRPLRTMADMGMAHTGMGGMAGMEGMSVMAMDSHASEQGGSAAGHGAAHGNVGEQAKSVPHGPDDHGIGNSAVPTFTRSRLDDPGTGLGTDGRRVLVYADLKSLEPNADEREPGREIELHLTGNMERYIWGFDGKKYSEAKTPIAFRYGERLRLTLVNDTMMEHPIHLHGMWMELENGAGPHKPRKHTVSVKPAERVSVTITADAPGRWALHCHLLLHMDMGMFRVVEVSEDAVNPEHRGG
jgi:CopA family copper-resistance protein